VTETAGAHLRHDLNTQLLDILDKWLDKMKSVFYILLCGSRRAGSAGRSVKTASPFIFSRPTFGLFAMTSRPERVCRKKDSKPEVMMKKSTVFLFLALLSFFTSNANAQVEILNGFFSEVGTYQPPVDQGDIIALSGQRDGKLIVGTAFSQILEDGNFSTLDFNGAQQGIIASAENLLATIHGILRYRWDGRIEMAYQTSMPVSALAYFPGKKLWMAALGDTLLISGRKFTLPEIPRARTYRSFNFDGPRPAGNNWGWIDYWGGKVSIFDIAIRETAKPGSYEIYLATYDGLIIANYDSEDLELKTVKVIFPGRDFRAVENAGLYVFAGRQSKGLSGTLLKINDGTVVDSLAQKGLYDIIALAYIEDVGLFAGSEGSGVVAVSLDLTRTARLPGISADAPVTALSYSPSAELYVSYRPYWGALPTLGIYSVDSVATAVRYPKSRPAQFTLRQNYPNPFNPTTNITYTLTDAAQVKLSIFNLLGQRVATLMDGLQTPGQHTVAWDATDNRGQAVSAGIYFYKLKANGKVKTRKMAVLR